jgi:hypothetical protein
MKKSKKIIKKLLQTDNETNTKKEVVGFVVEEMKDYIILSNFSDNNERKYRNKITKNQILKEKTFRA